MPYGNQQGLIGSTIDPRLFLQDYSGFVDAAKTNAIGTANAIGQISEGFAERAKQQKEDKNKLKAGATLIESAINLFPQSASALSGVREQLSNEEIPISERAAIASQISSVINLGVDQMRYNTELGFKQQDQQNQNQESAMRQWAFGQEVSAAERQQSAHQLDTKTKATIGPALLQQVIDMAPKAIGDQVKAQAGDYTADEQYQLAASVMSLLPKSEQKKAPTVVDVAVPGGSQKMQWDGNRGDWIPIQTAIAASTPTLADPNSKPLSDGLNPKFTEPWKAFQSQFPKTSIKSGFRSPSHNAKVGGAKGSQHTHGNAIDIDVSSLDENQREQALEFWASQGAKGFGYYNGNSIHVDFRDNPATWGPNYSKSSLPSTPKYFQRFSENLLSGKYQQGQSQPIGFTPDKPEGASVTEQLAVQRQQQEIQKEETTRQTALANSQNLIDDLSALKSHKGFNGLFGFGVGERYIPGSNAVNAETLLNKIKGQSFLQAVQGLRGMGALSDAEGKKLTDAFLGLDPSMSEQAAKQEIDKLIGNIKDSMTRAKSISGESAPTMQADPAANAANKLKSLLQGNQ